MEDRKNAPDAVDYVKRDSGLFKWLDNFWYHHKWKTIITSFLLLTLLVCSVQLFSREETDIYILYAGPYKFGQSDTRRMQSAFASIADDRTGDGKCNVTLVDLYMMSDEQIAGEVAKAEAAGIEVSVNYELFRANRKAFDEQILAGDAVICLLDPWLYADVRDAGGFLPLAEVLGAQPSYAVDDYAVRVADTPAGQYFSILAGLDEDTLLCVRRMSSFSFFKGKDKTERYHAYCLSTVRKMFDFTPAAEE